MKTNSVKTFYSCKRFCFFIFFVANTLFLFAIKSAAQGKYYGEAEQLDVDTRLKKIPALDVWTKNGTQYELNDYIRKNQLHSGKATLLLGFGTAGNYDVDEIVEIAKSTIPDNYNVIVLCMGLRHRMTNNELTEDRYERLFGKLLVIKTTWDEVQSKLYMNSWPFSIYADKNGNIIYTNPSSIIAKSSRALLDLIQDGKIVQGGKRWLNKEKVWVESKDTGAYYYMEYVMQGNRIKYSHGTKTKELSKVSYLYKDNLYYNDGDFQVYSEEGQQLYSASFKEGVPVTTIKAWHEDGKIKFHFPLTGTVKAFDTNGQVVVEGTAQNGLGNGTFYHYDKGIKIAEYNYKAGNLNGLQREYKENVLSKEFFVSALYEGYGEISDGLQKVKIKGLWGFVDRNGKQVIKPQYESAEDFKKGVADVKKNGNSFLIDKKGKEITSEEAKKIRAGWKPGG